jgi:hypothetical protein
MAQAPTVDIIGLRALNRDIKRMCGDQAGPLFAAMREAGRLAAQPVAAAVREAYPQDGGQYDKHPGRLAGSVRVSATRSGAGVRVGNKGTVPYAGAVDFGGYPPKKSTAYPFISAGRYLYPTAQNENLAATAGHLYTEAAQKAFDNFGWTNKTTNAGSVHD